MFIWIFLLVCGMCCKYFINNLVIVWYFCFLFSGSGMYCIKFFSGIWLFVVQELFGFFWILWWVLIFLILFGRLLVIVFMILFNVIIFLIELNLFMIKVKWVLVLWNCFRVGSSGNVFGKISGWWISVCRLSGLLCSDCCNRLMMWMMLSKFFCLFLFVMIRCVCWFFFSRVWIFVFGVLRLICLILWCDVMMLFMVCWLRFSICLIILCFCGLKIWLLLWFVSIVVVLVFFFLLLISCIMVFVVCWCSVWLVERKWWWLKIVSWLSDLIIIEKLIVVYRYFFGMWKLNFFVIRLKLIISRKLRYKMIMVGWLFINWVSDLLVSSIRLMVIIIVVIMIVRWLIIFMVVIMELREKIVFSIMICVIIV